MIIRFILENLIIIRYTIFIYCELKEVLYISLDKIKYLFLGKKKIKEILVKQVNSDILK